MRKLMSQKDFMSTHGRNGTCGHKGSGTRVARAFRWVSVVCLWSLRLLLLPCREDQIVDDPDKNPHQEGRH